MSLISPLAFIGEGVEIGENVSIGPFAVILGPCIIESDVFIGPGAQIGAPPEISSLNQNAAWAADLQHAGVIIKQGAVIREGVVIHQGTHRPTTLGSNSWLLNCAYLAHDVVVGEGTTISAGVSVGGHATIGNWVNIGMNASIHQRRVISTGAMVGMSTPVTKDVPPFAKVYGSPPRLTGVNSVGLERTGFSPETSGRLLSHYTAHGALFENGVPKNLKQLEEILLEWVASPNLKPINYIEG